MMRAFAIVTLLGLAACTPMPNGKAMTGEHGCGDTKVASLVGNLWTESLRAQTLKRSGARSLRVIAPDTAVTMDYRPDRLNIETDREGRITRLRCG